MTLIPLVTVRKVEKAPQETCADIGGQDSQIQEIKESVELPLTHPEYYEEMGIKPSKGVILYGAPGTGKILMAKAVANQTSATFLRVVGSELIQKYQGDRPKLVRELFREHAPSIVFIDEIDAIGSKLYASDSGGEREIQRTMLELLNQLDGFDSKGDVKVIMAPDRIETLDPAFIRPGRTDRKIEFPLPDEKTKRRIFNIHASRMTVADDVPLDDLILAKDDLSVADIKIWMSRVSSTTVVLNLGDLHRGRTHGPERAQNEGHRRRLQEVLFGLQEGTPEGPVPLTPDLGRLTPDLYPVRGFIDNQPRSIEHGRSTNRRTDCRVQGGVLLIRQGWRRHHHDQRAGHRDEVAGTEPHRGGAAGHDQRGRRRR
ncbi:unnamed protein product [Oncorhynchus mykiss]|uniref:AAA+ ATPase domain-containing protein n=1 Tax=Oncorhynchus mykiss TaxID=8022 RepID=A0A060XW88_ONCMY|nr:unnamed protein product [Oncorhynchus mykiss]